MSSEYILDEISPQYVPPDSPTWWGVKRNFSDDPYGKNIQTPSPHKDGYYNYRDIYDSLNKLYYKKSKDISYNFWRQKKEYYDTMFFSMFYIADKYKNKGMVMSDICMFVPSKEMEFCPVSKKGIDTNIKIKQEKAIEYWRNLMSDVKCKIIFILLITKYRANVNSTHANWIIIDKPRKTVEFFDPNGPEAYLKDEYVYNPVKAFTLTFKQDINTRFIPLKYKIVTYDKSCPNFNFQRLESYFGSTTEEIGDVEGWCLLWCIYLLELRLTNIGLRNIMDTSRNVIDVTLNRIRKENINIKSNPEIDMLVSNHFKNFAKDYSLYLNDIYVESTPALSIISSFFPNKTQQPITQRTIPTQQPITQRIIPTQQPIYGPSQNEPRKLKKRYKPF